MDREKIENQAYEIARQLNITTDEVFHICADILENKQSALIDAEQKRIADKLDRGGRRTNGAVKLPI